MVPDLVLICENMLMAEGFVKAKTLASKFHGLYSLLQELLSKQVRQTNKMSASIAIVEDMPDRKLPTSTPLGVTVKNCP